MSRLARYINTALTNILEQVSTQDGRNNGLNKLAFQLGQFVDNGISETEAIAHCENFAARCGLPEREAAATIKSGLSKGMLHPRDFSHLMSGLTPLARPNEHGGAAAVLSSSRTPTQAVAKVLRAVWEDFLRDGREDEHYPALTSFRQQRRLTDDDLAAATVIAAVDRDMTLASQFVDQNTTPEQRAEMGWCNGTERPWAPRDAYGILVPVWSDAWQEAPVAYRFRVVHSPTREHAKCYAMYGSADWRDTPLQHPGSLGRQGGTLVITEGEPDYLTLGKELVDRGCTVVGTPGAQWRTSWRYLLHGRDRVIVATHDDEAGYQLGKKIAATCKVFKVESRVVHPRMGDWSDARQRGVSVEKMVDMLLGGGR